MISEETPPSASDSSEDDVQEQDEGDPEANTPQEPAERKTFRIREPEVDPREEDAVLVLWGRYDSLGEAEPLLVFMELDEALSTEPEEEGEEDEENQTRTLDLRENLMGVPSADKKNHYDPSLDWKEFYSRLIDYNVVSQSIPEATLQDYRDTIQSYVNEVRIQWLNDFVDSENEDEIENWLDALRDEFFSPELGYYELNLQFVDPEGKTQNDNAPDGPSVETPEDTEESQPPATVKVSYVTNPTEGIPASSLNVGQEVYFRIIGEAVQQLPDELVDDDKSKPCSVPMVGPITDIEDDPDQAKNLDSDSKDYRNIAVEIEPSITGSSLVFKDDHIKVPVEDSDDPIASTDLVLFGILLVVVLALIFVLIFFL